jgi:hypothetical protein
MLSLPLDACRNSPPLPSSGLQLDGVDAENLGMRDSWNQLNASLRRMLRVG